LQDCAGKLGLGWASGLKDRDIFDLLITITEECGLPASTVKFSPHTNFTKVVKMSFSLPMTKEDFTASKQNEFKTVFASILQVFVGQVSIDTIVDTAYARRLLNEIVVTVSVKAMDQTDADGMVQRIAIWTPSYVTSALRAVGLIGATQEVAISAQPTVENVLQECTPLTITPLPYYIGPCHESAWREFWDPNSPLPTLVEMGVQLPYTMQDFNAALQESFKTAVGEAVEVESFRVQIKSITTIQAADISVTFSIRTPQDPRAGLNFARPDKAAELRAALTLSGILNERLLAKGVQAFSLVLQEPVVVPPSAVTNYCTTAVT
jgi:hypothetical protein